MQKLNREPDQIKTVRAIMAQWLVTAMALATTGVLDLARIQKSQKNKTKID